MTGAQQAARKPWVVGVSGASGTPYAAAALRGLLEAGESVDLVVSRAARLTILDETGIGFRDAQWRDDLAQWLGWDGGGEADKKARELLDAVRYWAAGDLAAGPSSGSYPVKGMLVIPASTASVAGIRLGLSKDLLQRAADVTLKERRPLVLVVRETPLNSQTLEHLLALSRAGVVVLPASPGFYAGAQDVQRLVDFVAGKALDVLGVEHSLLRRWQGELGSALAQQDARPSGPR
ncbi:UbiX family flavin prenyltransferase [Actinocrinis puniceicyclus]|uniref:Flavin prenyltransferase UbiX n=1 Tax=Actinocrinis puniceicyclus TaxID=977794 RepID=A0A8J7WHE4_9ACTN|nr:UbiX family flavin prenyltransferase [Actinocrinis puniceicyclus]MBS2962186.1 UbiX family flavin prenyltransferase [Actinocrinis puniceicyclus]